MLIYSFRRLLWITLVLIFATIITFLLIFTSPGDPAVRLAGLRPGDEDRFPEVIENVRRVYGLDQPVPLQYGRYMARLLQGDFGHSYYYRRPVLEVMLRRLPATALLALCIMAGALVLGIPLGIIMAVRSNSLIDRGLIFLGSLVISLPGFLIGLLLLYFLAFRLGLFPISGSGSWRHLVLPTLAGAIPTAVSYAFILRTNLLSMLGDDYARTAKAKGLTSRRVMAKHILPNAILPVVTIASIDMASLLTGIVLIEQVFSYPGIGELTLRAVQNKDIPVVMASVLFGGILIGFGNLAADLIAARLDPRIRLDS